MQTIVNQNELQKVLTLVSRVVDSRNTLPILGNVLIKAQKDNLKFIATNLELSISSQIPAKVKEEGEITIPAKLLSDYINLVSDQSVEFKTKDNTTLEIDTKESNTEIKGIVASEFPMIPKVQGDKKFKINSSALLKVINQTAFSASLDNTRPVLNGVYFKANNGNLSVAATDGYRLAERVLPLTEEKEKDKAEFILPLKTVAELNHVLSRFDEKVIIHVTKNQVLFELKDTQVISRLVEGKYPDYSPVIPKETKTKTIVNTAEFIKATKRASLFARENSHYIRIDVAKDKINISVDATQVGSNKAEISAKITGKEGEIALNANYLLDALARTEEKEVSFEINDKLSPAVIRTPKDKTGLYIIMPLKMS